jgi:hypothetical protein
MKYADIITFLNNKGWIYKGNCGCRSNYQMYSNETLPGVLIQINNTVFKIGKISNNNPASFISVCGLPLQYFDGSYQTWIANGRINPIRTS